ncbi:BUD13 homolog isoform X2 [Tenrec ecaudatus]|uniref:BUD13 homolog isoform X2 n=1 Tax=Tenrec ecaudatus TaxID=94439 RepID=UPI003F591614
MGPRSSSPWPTVLITCQHVLVLHPDTNLALTARMRIVDDDVSWATISTPKPEKEEDEDDGDLPVVAEFVDERPEEVKQMEAFRTSAKWKLLGGHSEDLASQKHFHGAQGVPASSPPRRVRHDTPDSSPPRRVRHDTPDSSPPRRVRHDTPDSSPPRRVRHDTPDSFPPRRVRHDTPDSFPPRRVRHDTPDSSPPRRVRHDTPDSSPPRRVRHDSPDSSPPRRVRHDTPDSSPPRRICHDSPDSFPPRRVRHDTPDSSPPRRVRHDSPDPSPPRRPHRNSSAVCPWKARHDSPALSPLRRGHHSSSAASSLPRARHDSPSLSSNSPHSPPRTKNSQAPDRVSRKTPPPRKGSGPSHPSSPKSNKGGRASDLSPPRKKQAKSHFLNKRASKGHPDSGSDLSPPRKRPSHQSSDSDLSPPRRKRRTHSSDSDLSPPRRSQPPGKKAAHMLSGAKTGLVLTDIQREQQELKKQEQTALGFEAEFQFAETVFRDKSGRKRNLKLERLEQKRKAEKDTERDELYAQWGKGLAQSRQQQQNLEDAMKEMQKPLARYIDDEDLDRMLREQERDGDPMANFIKKNKAKENKNKKVRPRYSGPAPPPNRFNIWPGYRWDGVDRSNGFEQKRFARLASKKAVEELAYKWGVEDM